jgi:hypothetical protein
MFSFCLDKENPVAVHRIQETGIMTKWRLFHLKNEMLAANLLANFIGAFLVQGIIFRAETPFPESLFDNRLVYFFDVAFTPLAFLFAAAATLIYERSIRQYLTAKSNRIPISPQLESRARRKILNEPFVLIGTDGIWESQNAKRQMFGKKRFRDLIRTHARKPAKDILDAVIASLDEFRHPMEKEDDVTLVVIKVEP